MLPSRLEFPFVVARLCNTQWWFCQDLLNYLFKHSFALTKKKRQGKQRGESDEKLLNSHTMNKLIKKPPLHFPPLNTWNHPQIKKYEGKRGREVGRKKEGESWSETENVCVCRSTTTRRKWRGVEPIGEETGSKREKPHELLEWCASPSPLAYPKIPGAGNVKARRTTDAIPQRGSAGIISEGNGGLKWRTNFSKTSSEGNVHALRLFFSSLPPPALPLLSLYSSFVLCFTDDITLLPN